MTMEIDRIQDYPLDAEEMTPDLDWGGIVVDPKPLPKVTMQDIQEALDRIMSQQAIIAGLPDDFYARLCMCTPGREHFLTGRPMAEYYREAPMTVVFQPSPTTKWSQLTTIVVTTFLSVFVMTAFLLFVCVGF